MECRPEIGESTAGDDGIRVLVRSGRAQVAAVGLVFDVDVVGEPGVGGDIELDGVLAGDAKDGFGMLAFLGGRHVVDERGEEELPFVYGWRALGGAD